jgi:hypothetical protein
MRRNVGDCGACDVNRLWASVVGLAWRGFLGSSRGASAVCEVSGVCKSGSIASARAYCRFTSSRALAASLRRVWAWCLQARRVRRLGVGLGLSDTSVGRGLVGERFALSYRVGLFGSVDADGPGFHPTMLFALIHNHNAEGDESQDRGEREERDDDDRGGGHFGSLGLVERGCILISVARPAFWLTAAHHVPSKRVAAGVGLAGRRARDCVSGTVSPRRHQIPGRSSACEGSEPALLEFCSGQRNPSRTG